MTYITSLEKQLSRAEDMFHAPLAAEDPITSAAIFATIETLSSKLNDHYADEEAYAYYLASVEMLPTLEDLKLELASMTEDEQTQQYETFQEECIQGIADNNRYYQVFMPQYLKGYVAD